MRLVAELDLRDFELALLFDVGLLGAVDHDVGDQRIVQQLFEGAKAQQFVYQNLFECELLAPVERQLEFGQHFSDDRSEFLGQFVFRERCSSLGVDPFEQARKNLFLDLVDRGFEPFRLLRCGFDRVLALGEPLHRAHFFGRRGPGGILWRQLDRADGWELSASCRVFVGTLRGSSATLHGTRNTKGRAVRAQPTRPIASSKSTHVTP